MKKITDFIKPNILIIFGALFFLYYLQYLSYSGAGLALGIVAVVFSAYYLAIGILGIIMGDKLSPMLKKIFEVVSVSLFAIFMFVYFLLVTINVANAMGPTAWTIKILSMIASLALVGAYVASRFVNKPILNKFASLFAIIFVLVLLLELLFNVDGSASVLGNIDVLLAAIYAFFTVYLFSTLQNGEAAPQQVEEKKEEPKEEPAAEK